MSLPRAKLFNVTNSQHPSNSNQRSAANVDNLRIVRVGTSSWADRSLTHDSNWYPRRTMKASERIAHYASVFSVTEIDSTFRFPPTPDVAEQWVQRSPDNFRFDIQAWSLLTRQPAMPASLWEDLAGEIPVAHRDKPRLYDTHLSADALDECWVRFIHALAPLRAANKLGAVILRYPHWFKPSENNIAQLADARLRLGDMACAVELSCGDWFGNQHAERTYEILESLNLALVCIDCAPTHRAYTNNVLANTNELAIVRLLGRHDFSDDKSDEESWSRHWRGYKYSQAELRELAQSIKRLSDCATETHIIVSTCWQDHAVTNAQDLQRELLA